VKTTWVLVFCSTTEHLIPNAGNDGLTGDDETDIDDADRGVEGKEETGVETGDDLESERTETDSVEVEGGEERDGLLVMEAFDMEEDAEDAEEEDEEEEAVLEVTAGVEVRGIGETDETEDTEGADNEEADMEGAGW